MPPTALQRMGHSLFALHTSALPSFLLPSFSVMYGRFGRKPLGLVISSFLMLVGNILSDICVALVDPRIRFGKE